MTTVNTPATPKLGTVAPFAIARREAIDTALSLALHHIRRHQASPSDLQTATARARRALTLLKHASASAAPASPSTTSGRV